jgi:hypothetical protein
MDWKLKHLESCTFKLNMAYFSPTGHVTSKEPPTKTKRTLCALAAPPKN